MDFERQECEVEPMYNEFLEEMNHSLSGSHGMNEAGSMELEFTAQFAGHNQPQQQQHHGAEWPVSQVAAEFPESAFALKSPDYVSNMVYVEDNQAALNADKTEESSAHYSAETSDQASSPRSPCNGESSDDSSPSSPMQTGSPKVFVSSEPLKPVKTSARLMMKKSESKSPTDTASSSGSSSSYGKISARQRQERNRGPYETSHLPKSERNRESAARYRQRRKEYVNCLERELSDLKEKVGSQNASIQVLKAENTMMKERLSFLQRMCEASGLSVGDSKLGSRPSKPTVVLLVLFSCMMMTLPFASMFGVNLNRNMGPAEPYNVEVGSQFRVRNILVDDTTGSFAEVENANAAAASAAIVANTNTMTIDATGWNEGTTPNATAPAEPSNVQVPVAANVAVSA